MRKVIDSNFLQDERLRKFLASSKSNFAVLTDYSAIEAYKGDSLESIFKSMSIVSDFPSQITIIKSTNTVCGLHGKSSGLQKRLIDYDQGKRFKQFSNDLTSAKNGNHSARSQILKHGQAANLQIKRIQNDINEFKEGILLSINLYSKEERAQIRNKIVPQALIKKIGGNILTLAASMLAQHPNAPKNPCYAELLNTYIFRYALCAHLLVLKWGIDGGVNDAGNLKLQNDLIDMSFAAYATYFDGILSADQKCVNMYQQAHYWLTQIFKS